MDLSAEEWMTKRTGENDFIPTFTKLTTSYLKIVEVSLSLLVCLLW